MAILLMNAVFEKTWGQRAGEYPAREYWVEIIEAVRSRHPGALFMAEAYWNLEWELQQQGFDFCYDKRLYDRMVSGTAEQVRLHLLADISYQDMLLRFIENHDEPRAAAVFNPPRHRCAAVAFATLPGAKLIHDGQIDGRRVRIPVALGRRPQEEAQSDFQSFYHRLLTVASSGSFHDGEWRLCDRSGWPDNSSWIDILAWCWRKEEERYLIAVNLSDRRSQALIQIPWQDIRGKTWKLADVLSDVEYERDGDQMLDQGLFVDLTGWNYHFLRFLK